MFQIGWWTSWKCHLRGRSCSRSRRCFPRRGCCRPETSIEIGARCLDREVWPCPAPRRQKSVPHADVAGDRPRLVEPVSFPNSPGRGIVLKVHNRLPVRTSNPRTSPLVLLWVFGVPPSRNADPTMTTPSLVTDGVECTPISPVTRSICCPLPNTTPSFKSTMPSLPKDAMRWRSGVERTTGSRSCVEDAFFTPSVQYAHLDRTVDAATGRRARPHARHASTQLAVTARARRPRVSCRRRVHHAVHHEWCASA